MGVHMVTIPTPAWKLTTIFDLLTAELGDGRHNN